MAGIHSPRRSSLVATPRASRSDLTELGRSFVGQTERNPPAVVVGVLGFARASRSASRPYSGGASLAPMPDPLLAGYHLVDIPRRSGRGKGAFLPGAAGQRLRQGTGGDRFASRDVVERTAVRENLDGAAHARHSAAALFGYPRELGP